MQNFDRWWHENKEWLGKLPLSANDLIGELLVYVSDDPEICFDHPDDEVKQGDIGLCIDVYEPNGPKYLRGFEPITVLFGGKVVKVYVDEVRLLSEK